MFKLIESVTFRCKLKHIYQIVHNKIIKHINEPISKTDPKSPALTKIL